MYVPRRLRAGSRGAATWPQCHVASTWPARKIKSFLPIFLIILNDFQSKIKLKKFRKIPKIVKIISFKIQLQINPNFFHLIWNLIIYHSKNSKYLNNKRFNLYFKNTLISLRF